MKRQHGMLVFFLMAFLSGCQWGRAPVMPGANPVLGDPPPRRTIRFPEERIMGKVYVCAWEDLKKEYSGETSWTEHAVARGDVDIPAGHGAALLCVPESDAAKSAPLDLSPLDALDPSDLQGILFVFARLAPGELERLRRFPGLVLCQIGFTELDEGCLEVLGKLESLKVLNLPELATLNDAGLRHFVGCRNLEVLNLYGTRITDSGLKYLERLPHLKWLDVRRTGVTNEGLKKLQEARPVPFNAVWGTY